MKTEEINKVSDFLTTLGIKHEVSNDVILVDRDSICNKVSGVSEQDHYDVLRARINDALNVRAFYTAKTDEWLMMETINATR